MADGLKDRERGDTEEAGTPLVVAIGASGAAPDSIDRFFSAFDVDSNLALVLVVQRREALDDAHLAEILTRVEGLRTAAATDGLTMEGGTAYVCEPDKITTLEGGRFVVRQAEQAPGMRGTIDSFLVSLAVERGDEAIGIVLAGTGEDGTLGVTALKDRGGLAIVERPAGDEAQLENANTPAALADLLLTPEEMPDQVTAYVQHLMRAGERKAFDAVIAAAAGALTQIAELLRIKTGNDFHGYKKNTFLRRVQRRMHVVQIDSIDGYVDFLRTDREEVQNLFNDLLIGVTQFFRDKGEFALLERDILPKMFDGKTAGQTIRVWVLGCATGEEAYSIGIALREHMTMREFPLQVQIFATDIDGRALAAARVGRYRATIEQDVSPARLARWFVREGDTYCVVKELREMVIFSQHNVLKDAPFSRLDLVSCRNLLIYLNADLQERVIPLFHFALLPDRYLFLGSSENVSRHPKLFVPVVRNARIFKRLEAKTRQPPEFPLSKDHDRTPIGSGPRRPGGLDQGLGRRAQQAAERHAPAYVIVDQDFQVLHFSGRIGRYLEPASGAATLDLLNLVHRDLRLELRVALNRAVETNRPVQLGRMTLGAESNQPFVELLVEPIRESAGGPLSLVVLFRDGPSRTPDADVVTAGSLVPGEHVEHLEAELRAARERLQSTVEELESANEELKSSNEEYQSLNEELQSANEELQTSREELQSMNEELTTVNGELGHRVQELTRATSDLKNLLESTQIATVFLDNDLKVMSFTPAVRQLFHLVDTDVGRPITHIKAQIAIDELFEDVDRVLRTLATIERDMVMSETGTRYIVRILPYRSVDNFIAGVVITFTDITAMTRAEERQRFLTAELHRVRNTLGVVRSIVRRSADTSETIEDYVMHVEGRLNAFARTHALLTREPDAGVDLEYLVVEELLSYQTSEGERLHVFGPSVRMQPKAAESLGLAIHELATNAIKYGALSNRSGRVDVTWRVTSGATPLLVLDWLEKGGPPLPSRTPRRGFGTELLENALALELRAETRLDFHPSGLHCTIELSFTNHVVVTGSVAS